MRQEFPDWIKIRAYQRARGCCQKCKRAVRGDQYQTDHIIPDWLGGKPELANAMILCNDCHHKKTARDDLPRIAKTKRQKAKHEGTWRETRHPLPGSRLSKWKKPMRGRTIRRPPNPDAIVHAGVEITPDPDPETRR